MTDLVGGDILFRIASELSILHNIIKKRQKKAFGEASKKSRVPEQMKENWDDELFISPGMVDQTIVHVAVCINDHEVLEVGGKGTRCNKVIARENKDIVVRYISGVDRYAVSSIAGSVRKTRRSISHYPISEKLIKQPKISLYDQDVYDNIALSAQGRENSRSKKKTQKYKIPKVTCSHLVNAILYRAFHKVPLSVSLSGKMKSFFDIIPSQMYRRFSLKQGIWKRGAEVVGVHVRGNIGLHF